MSKKGSIPWNKGKKELQVAWNKKKPIKRICFTCKKVFYTKQWRINIGKGRYCSKKCWYISKECKKLLRYNCRHFKKGFTPWNKGKPFFRMRGKNNPKWKESIKKNCLICNKIFFIIPSRKNIAKFCSRKCYTKYQTKDKIIHQGYICIHKPEHPFARKGKYIFEHRFIMEQIKGRYLNSNERVHHKGIKYPIGSTENKQDNRPINLQLLTNIEHIKLHAHLKLNVI